MYRFRPGIAIVLFGLASIVATPCLAQLNQQGTGLSTSGAALQRNLRGSDAKPEPAQPPVLPGTKGTTEAAAPTASPADMSPTDALFDAINRGDLPGARDAVNRGAQLDGLNVLGMTPLELSVDLGRNDISFMLLSMRSDSPAARQTARSGVQVGGQGGVERETPKTASRGRVIPAASRGPAAEELADTPRYSSGNGGVPIPAAGFLGFDEGRATR